jgi:hypothetical protein
MARHELETAISELGLTITSEFVPFSQSRNKGEKYPSLNWRVTLQKNGRAVLTTDYTAGSGHAPSYKQGDNTVDRNNMVRFECENGYPASNSGGGPNVHRRLGGGPIKPDAADVINSLAMDSDVIDHPTFESWASELGYDVDSRSVEKTYRACLEIALKLRAGIGEDGLAKLRKAGEDY